ncbi:MAG: putative hydrolase YxeP [Phycisphaerae bacterium]|nr:putative hydrolase YxeP [Phycisphaerae bacterium]
MSDAIGQEVDARFERLVAIRHELHAHPEVSWQEHETARRLAGWLGEIPGLTVKTGLGKGTGLLAELDTGRPGPVIALRADIDALPVQEENDFAWKSTRPGVMHACGHEGHTTCLLGAAMVLASMRDRLTGRVRFIFQPAEEAGPGAVAMIADGVLDDPPVQAIFALHGSPEAKVGAVLISPTASHASADSWKARIVGRGCHGGYPANGIDPIMTAGQALVALQTAVSRNVDPLRPGVVTVGSIHGGSAGNVIPDAVELLGTIRAQDPDTRQLLHRRVREIVTGVAASMGCTAELTLGSGYPPNINDARLSRWVGELAAETLGPAAVDANRRAGMGGEDFAFYAQKVPSCFFYVGTCPPGRDGWPSLHNPRYDFSDGAIRVGVGLLSRIVERASQAGLPLGQ